MKKIMLFAAACVALAACSKEIDTTTSEIGNGTAFEKGQKVTLTVRTGDQTKVSSELVTSGTDKDKVNFKWETGDKIKVTVGTKSAEFTLKTGAGESSATFEGTMPEAGETFAVQYPVTDPDLISQTYVANALPKDKMKMAATGCTLDTPFTLTPQYAALRLNLWGSKTVGKIVVTKIDSNDPSFTLDCGTGVTTGATKADSTAFFIVVTEGSFKFSAEIFDNAATPASICKFETTNAHPFTAGQIQNMPAKEVKAALPDGALPGVFSVSATTKVHFSKGNMYYDGSAFQFEANQYSSENTWSTSHVSHFYWSKTASVAYAENYTDDSRSESDVFFTNATETTPKSDFTVNGAKGVWRTLSKDEWKYLLSASGRGDGDTNFKYGVDVCGKANCLVIAPDGNTTSIADSYDATACATAEANGFVFLPAAGYRSDSDVDYVGDCGYYWSSTAYDLHDAYYLYFDSDYVGPDFLRYSGYSVRLVSAAQ